MLALTKLLRVAAPRSHPAPLRWGHKPKYTPGISPCKSANAKPKINQTECSLSVFPCLSFGKVWKWFSAKVDGLMVAKSQLLFGACQSRKRPRRLGPRHCQAPQPWCSLSSDKKVLIFRRKKCLSQRASWPEHSNFKCQSRATELQLCLSRWWTSRNPSHLPETLKRGKMLHEPTLRLQNQVKRSLRTNMQCFNQIHQCPSSAPFQGSITSNQKWNPRQKKHKKNTLKSRIVQRGIPPWLQKPADLFGTLPFLQEFDQIWNMGKSCSTGAKENKKIKQRDAANSTSHVLKVCLICKIAKS